MTDEVRAGRRRIPISSADRVLIPGEGGVTKLDLARHYAAVGEVMVPHVRDRPLALQGFPHGIEEGGFYLKEAPKHFPDWIARAEVPKREGGVVHHVLANDPATLVYLAGQNVITPHVWTSRADMLERPDRLIFDLDPSKDDFAEVRATARALGDLLRGVGLEPFAMTTGSRGLHVTVPLRRTAEYPDVQAFAREAAAAARGRPPRRPDDGVPRREAGRAHLPRHQPHRATASTRSRPTRCGRWRARPWRPRCAGRSSTTATLGPQGWSVATIGARLSEGGDPWSDIARAAKAIGPARAALARLAALGRMRSASAPRE